MADKIKFLKIRDVKSPSRANQYDAGIDFFVPKFDPLFIKDLKDKNPLIFYDSTSNIVSGSTTLTIQGNSPATVDYDLNDKNDSVIKFDDENALNYFLLAPHQRIMIPAGIKSRMAEPGRALIAGNKSGVATRLGLIFGAQVVDYLYQGEIHISIINTSTKVVRIYEDMKLIQFLETPIFNSNIEITASTVKDGIGNFKTPINFYEGMSIERGESGFGSSDKKESKKSK